MVRVLLMAAVLIIATGCGKSTPTTATPEPARKKKPIEEEPTLIVWEDGRLTGQVVIEFKNLPEHADLTVSVEGVQKDGNKYVFPGKRWQGGGGNTEGPKIIVYEKDGTVRCAHPDGLWYIRKEKDKK